MEYIFELEMQVRDYECDMEGIVNNAIYQHYLEHTRHEFFSIIWNLIYRNARERCRSGSQSHRNKL